MPFLAPLLPSLGAGAASAAGGAAINGAVNGKKDPQKTLAQYNQLQSIGLLGPGMPQLQVTLPTPDATPADAAQVTTSAALDQQKALADQLAAQNGIQHQNDVYGQQQALATQLGAMSRGEGPNPALDQLNQSTGQNIAQQGALMAGQRGAGANVGLLARQAAQVGAGIQQNAVGQAATLRSNQQLAAINALQQQQNMLGNLGSNQVAQQSQGLNNYTNNAQTNQGQLLNAQTSSANAQLGADTQTSIANNKNSIDIGSGIAKGAGAALVGSASPSPTPALTPRIPMSPVQTYGNTAPPMAALAEGGQVANMKENYAGQSRIGKHLAMYAKGGKVSSVDVILSPGEIVLSPEQAKKAKGGEIDPKDGKKVPGKANVGGAVNSYANDVVPAKVKAGSVVLPRSVTQAKDPKEAEKKFIETLKAKKGKK